MLSLTFSYIFYIWLISLILQLVGAVWLFSLPSNPLADKGWAAGRVLCWLALSLIVWFTAHLGLPTNTQAGILSFLFLFCGLSLWLFKRHHSTIVSTLKSRLPLILTQEALFLIGLVFLTLVRGFNPDIRDLEKPMDAGFMASYLRSSTLPAPDMWLAGETINYYSFGHFMGSVFTQLSFLEIAYSYNLLLALILGLTLSLSFSITTNLLQALRPQAKFITLLPAGIASSFLVAIGGNSHTIWYFLSNRNWEGYWYADATRFIETTIHEFPSYSFVVADIHAHVWNLPLVLTFILLCFFWLTHLFSLKLTSLSPLKYNSKYLKRFLSLHLPILPTSLLLGVFIGTFAMTNAWDTLIYPMLLIVIGFLVIFYDYRRFASLLLSAFIAIPTAALTALPWYLHFTSISEGIARVSSGSPLWQLAVLWTGHLLMSLTALAIALILLSRSKRSQPAPSLLLISGLVFTAIILLVLPEVIYFKDIYTGHPRANTMFKLTYQAFIMMSLAGSWAFGYFLTQSKLPKLIRGLTLTLFLALFAAFATFPYFAYRGYYNNLRGFKGIHGYQWLKDKSPSDFAAISWLNQNVVGSPVILEAVGESYTEYNQVSAITGLPAVLGWRVHEWLWRGGFDVPGARTEEVRTIYTNPLSPQSRSLLDRYRVEYIFVGSKEFEAYPNLSAQNLSQLGDVVFSHGRTFIIHRSL